MPHDPPREGPAEVRFWINLGRQEAEVLIQFALQTGRASLARRLHDALAPEQGDLLAQYRAYAQATLAEDGAVEVDDDAQVSLADTGAWVAAWHWVEGAEDPPAEDPPKRQRP